MNSKDHKDLVAESLVELHWPEATARELARSAHVITYEKGSRLFHAGEPADLLYVLLSGEVKLYYGNQEGERLLVDLVRPRQTMGHLITSAGGGDEPLQRFSAEALSRCTVALITASRLGSAAATLPPPVVARMTRLLADRWAQLSERALLYLTMDVRGRLTAAIQDIANRFGIRDARGTLIPLRLSHEDFGELIGASRPMVSKHLKELADLGVLFKANGRYVLANGDALRRGAAVPPVGAPKRPPLRAVPGKAALGLASARRVRPEKAAG